MKAGTWSGVFWDSKSGRIGPNQSDQSKTGVFLAEAAGEEKARGGHGVRRRVSHKATKAQR